MTRYSLRHCPNTANPWCVMADGMTIGVFCRTKERALAWIAAQPAN